MRRSRFPAIVVAVCAACSAGADLVAGEGSEMPAHYYDSRERGWFWYEDPPPKRDPVPIPEAGSPPAGEAVQRLEAYKAVIQEARARAFLEPTPENLQRVAELQTRMVKRASDAADVWQRVIWANPQYDFTLERPVTRVGLDAYNAKAAGQKRATFEKMAAENVLYFFFRSDCPYCHAFAPVLAAFTRATGIRVFPVSLDGAGLPDYPAPNVDNGISRTLGVDTVPALFLADPARGRISPVGYGVMSEMELAERLVALANPPSASVRAATPAQSFTPEIFR